MALYGTHPEHESAHEHPDGDTEAVAIEVDAEVRVPRGEMGDLPAGVTDVLANVGGATVVDVGEIDLVQPASLDIYVDVTARIEGDFGDRDADALAAHVADAFGVETVHAVAIEYAPRGADEGIDPPHDHG
ncbi:hypothetical protein [Haloglomus salinum]|jgi:hypothetical protein|uniref:hypothetical protein n=1 Tax=Haloglomus salinum TaxID=2962673 RepID=UPI0020C97FEE|nr:hypothetical protein [Haloglomus salinum]